MLPQSRIKASDQVLQSCSIQQYADTTSSNTFCSPGHSLPPLVSLTLSGHRFDTLSFCPGAKDELVDGDRLYMRRTNDWKKKQSSMTFSVRYHKLRVQWVTWVGESVKKNFTFSLGISETLPLIKEIFLKK